MVISLQRYWKLKEAHRLAPVGRPDEELACANCNPELPSLLQSSGPTGSEPPPQRSESDA